MVSHKVLAIVTVKPRRPRAYQNQRVLHRCSTTYMHTGMSAQGSDARRRFGAQGSLSGPRGTPSAPPFTPNCVGPSAPAWEWQDTSSYSPCGTTSSSIVMYHLFLFVFITCSDGSSAGGGAPGASAPEGASMGTSAAAVVSSIEQQKQQHTPPLSLLPLPRLGSGATVLHDRVCTTMYSTGPQRPLRRATVPASPGHCAHSTAPHGPPVPTPCRHGHFGPSDTAAGLLEPGPVATLAPGP